MASTASLTATYCEPSLLQPICGEIQKVHELAEHKTFGGRVLLPEVAELLDERLDLRRRPPLVQVQPAEDTLTLCDGLVQLEGRRLKVNGERDVTNRACRLQGSVSIGNAIASLARRTMGSTEASRYCLIHSRSKMCRHFAWIASSANSLQSRQTVPSPASSWTNTPALFLLRRTRSGWHAI